MTYFKTKQHVSLPWACSHTHTHAHDPTQLCPSDSPTCRDVLPLPKSVLLCETLGLHDTQLQENLERKCETTRKIRQTRLGSHDLQSCLIRRLTFDDVGMPVTQQPQLLLSTSDKCLKFRQTQALVPVQRATCTKTTSSSYTCVLFEHF